MTKSQIITNNKIKPLVIKDRGKEVVKSKIKIHYILALENYKLIKIKENKTSKDYKRMSDCLHNLALIHESREEFTKAIELYKKSVIMYKYNMRSVFNLLFHYKKRNNKEMFIKCLRILREIFTNHTYLIPSKYIKSVEATLKDYGFLL